MESVLRLSKIPKYYEQHSGLFIILSFQIIYGNKISSMDKTSRIQPNLRFY